MFGHPTVQPHFYRGSWISNKTLPLSKDQALAIKRLQIKLGFSDQPFQVFCVKKKTLQTILKKQFPKQICTKILTPKSFTSVGVNIGNIYKDIHILGSGGLFITSFTTQDLIRCEKILLNSKRLEWLRIEYPLTPSPKLIKNIKLLRKLKSLTLRVPNGLFPPHHFDSLKSLRQLTLEIYPQDLDSSYNNKELLRSFKNFCIFLRSVKSLEFLDLNIKDARVYGSSKGFEDLLMTILESNISCYRLKLSTKGQEFNLERIKPFLERLECLCFHPMTIGFNFKFGLEFQKNLYLFDNFFNYKEIITKCSSLKGLYFCPENINHKLPKDLGSVKNITNFSIIIPDKSDKNLTTNLTNLREFLSKVPVLETFSISLHPPLTESLEELNHLHQMFSKVMLKNYTINFLNISPKNEYLSILFEQITTIQSLDSFNLKSANLENYKAFNILFGNFSKLKNLYLKLSSSVPASEFPFESLKEMRCLKSLEMILPKFDKKSLIPRIPKLTSVENLIISNILDGKTIILKDLNS